MPGQQPSVRKGPQTLGGEFRRSLAARHRQNEPARVPDLVGEPLRRLDGFFRERYVLASGGHPQQSESHRVGAVLRDQVEGVDDVAG